MKNKIIAQLKRHDFGNSLRIHFGSINESIDEVSVPFCCDVIAQSRKFANGSEYHIFNEIVMEVYYDIQALKKQSIRLNKKFTDLGYFYYQILVKNCSNIIKYAKVVK